MQDELFPGSEARDDFDPVVLTIAGAHGSQPGDRVGADDEGQRQLTALNDRGSRSRHGMTPARRQARATEEARTLCRGAGHIDPNPETGRGRVETRDFGHSARDPGRVRSVTVDADQRGVSRADACDSRGIQIHLEPRRTRIVDDEQRHPRGGHRAGIHVPPGDDPVEGRE
jgi:hypothetical protein